MRRLTFKGFLESYVMELSYMGTCSISKLVNELDDNPRLREPLLLYAYLSKMLRGIEKKDAEFYEAYQCICRKLGDYEQESFLLLEKIESLSYDYKKIVTSYMYERTKVERDNHTKLLMRKAIIEIQEEKGITNYRIQKELKLNYGNMNYFLKNGSVEKLALETVREMLNYVRNYE